MGTNLFIMLQLSKVSKTDILELYPLLSSLAKADARHYHMVKESDPLGITIIIKDSDCSKIFKYCMEHGLYVDSTGVVGFKMVNDAVNFTMEFKSSIVNSTYNTELPNNGKYADFALTIRAALERADRYADNNLEKLFDCGYDTTANGWIRSFKGKRLFSLGSHQYKVFGVPASGDADYAVNGIIKFERV